MPKQTLSFEEIRAILPHRYPFLLVDRVIDMNEKRVVAIKNVTGNEEFFQGHFPSKPVMPGVLIIEALAQAGGLLILSNHESRGKLAYLAGINEARFRKIVTPGDQLRLEVEIIKVKARVSLVKANAFVGDEEAVSAEILFSVGS